MPSISIATKPFEVTNSKIVTNFYNAINVLLQLYCSAVPSESFGQHHVYRFGGRS